MTFVATLTGCGGGAQASTPTVTVWAHAGTPAERSTLERQVAAYNALGHQVELRVLAEGDYGDAIAAAAAGGQLPDVIELDAPTVASRAFAGDLASLDHLLPAATWKQTLPSLSAAGSWNGTHWAVGTFDSGLALFANKRMLAEAGVEVPSGAWSAADLTSALRALAKHDGDGKVLDLKRNYGVGEWLTYGLSPLLYSAGGALVDADGRATGTLDGAASVAAMQQLASWRDYVDPDTDNESFTRGRVALSWVGHWQYRDYVAALGDDLAVIPLPDLGAGSKTSLGSWMWSISGRSQYKGLAADFLTWLTADAQIADTTAANAAVPGTVGALAASPLYAEGGALETYRVALEHACPADAVTATCDAVARPATPAYPVITAAFAAAADAILDGAPVESTLRQAATAIDRDAAANNYYR